MKSNWVICSYCDVKIKNDKSETLLDHMRYHHNKMQDIILAQANVIEAAKGALKDFEDYCGHGEYGIADAKCRGCNKAKEALSQIAALEKK